MILSLPKTQSWEVVKITLFEIKKLTSKIVSLKLLQEANCCTREKSSDTALMTRNTNQKGKGCGHGSGRKPKPDNECNYCDEKGHWANKCKKREADEKKKDSANLTVDNLRDLGTREVGRVYMAMNGSRKGSNLVLDCAATSHMFTDTNYFMRYTSSAAVETISVGDGHPLPIAGRGSFTFKSQLLDGILTVVLHRVTHLPRLQENLISLSKLEDDGAYGTFGGGCIKVMMGQGAAGTLFFDRMLKNFKIPNFWLTTPPPHKILFFLTEIWVDPPPPPLI